MAIHRSSVWTDLQMVTGPIHKARDRAPTDPARPPEFLGVWNWRDPTPGETIAQWSARQIKMRADLEFRTENWRHVGQKVAINYDPFSVLEGRLDDCTGVIHSLCSADLSDYVFVTIRRADHPHYRRTRLFGVDWLTPII
jgi:hypothetical protein